MIRATGVRLVFRHVPEPFTIDKDVFRVVPEPFRDVSDVFPMLPEAHTMLPVLCM